MKHPKVRKLQRALFDFSTGLCLKFHWNRLCTKIFDMCPEIEREMAAEADELMRKAELTMRISDEERDRHIEAILKRCHEMEEAQNRSAKSNTP